MCAILACSTANRVQELCESRGGRPGLSVLMSLTVPVDVMLRHWSQFVPKMSTDIRGHGALHQHLQYLKHIKEKLHDQRKDWNNVTHRQGNLIGRSEKGVFVTKAIYLSVKCGQLPSSQLPSSNSHSFVFLLWRIAACSPPPPPPHFSLDVKRLVYLAVFCSQH